MPTCKMRIYSILIAPFVHLQIVSIIAHGHAKNKKPKWAAFFRKNIILLLSIWMTVNIVTEKCDHF